MAGSESDTETSTRNPGAGHEQNGNGMPAGYPRTDSGLAHPPAELQGDSPVLLQGPPHHHAGVDGRPVHGALEEFGDPKDPMPGIEEHGARMSPGPVMARPGR